MTVRLLDYFHRQANHRGLVLASETQLVEELGISRDALAQTLKVLEADGKIELLAPLPYVVLKLLSWSGSSASGAQREQQISSSGRNVHIEVPVSSAAAAATQQEDGGVGEGDELLEQVLAALGPEADREEFRTIVAGHHPELIHRCLRRVRATKAIRVSRAALFRSLLQKLSH